MEVDQPPGRKRVGHAEKARRGGEALAARLGSVAIGIHGDRLREDRGGPGLPQEDLGDDRGRRQRIGHLASRPPLRVGPQPFRPGMERRVPRRALAPQIRPRDLTKRTIPTEVASDDVVDHVEGKGLTRQDVAGQDAAAMTPRTRGQGQTQNPLGHREKNRPPREPGTRPAAKRGTRSAPDPRPHNEGNGAPRYQDPLDQRQSELPADDN